MALWFYQHSGLQITSEIHLPEWSAFEKLLPDAAPDLRIFCSEERFWEDADTPVAIPSADEYRFGVPDTAAYRVNRAGEIKIRPVTGADYRKVRVFLLGAAWAAFCSLSSLFLLHASVVQVGKEAVAFCGPSGAGKSSLAAKLTTLGYPLVSDDLCRFDLHGGERPAVYTSATRLKLWREALSALEMDCGRAEQDIARLDKYHLPLAREFVPEERLPVTSVYLLAWGEPVRTRLRGTSALRRLVSAGTYHADILESTAGLARHWAFCAELAGRVPLWELTRPRDWAYMDTAAALVLESPQ